MRWRVYECLYYDGPLTMTEVDERCRQPGEVSPSYRKRLSELEMIGVVEVCGERRCTVTGRMCVLWQTNDNPNAKKLPKPRTNRETVAELVKICNDAIEWIDTLGNPLAAARIRGRLAATVNKQKNAERDGTP